MFCWQPADVRTRPKHVAVSKQKVVVFNRFVLECLAMQLAEYLRHTEGTLCRQVNSHRHFETSCCFGVQAVL